MRHGYYDGPGRATFIITGGEQRVGLIRAEALEDPPPTFDLRIASAHRGRGNGAAALRELARLVFDTHDVERLEGATASTMTRCDARSGRWASSRSSLPPRLARDGRLLYAVGYAPLRTGLARRHHNTGQLAPRTRRLRHPGPG